LVPRETALAHALIGSARIAQIALTSRDRLVAGRR
jgi:hypothetical protein